VRAVAAHGQAGVALCLRREKWFSPDVSIQVAKGHVLGIERGKVQLVAELLPDSKLLSLGLVRLAFLEPPKVVWEIDIAPFFEGFPLPDFLEEEVPQTIVSNFLAQFTPEYPFFLPLPFSDHSKSLLGDRLFSKIGCTLACSICSGLRNYVRNLSCCCPCLRFCRSSKEQRLRSDLL